MRATISLLTSCATLRTLSIYPRAAPMQRALLRRLRRRARRDGRASRSIAIGLLCAACYAAPPPPADPGSLTRCHPGAYGALSELRCNRDSDCVLCASPDGCVLRTRGALAVSNEPCARPRECNADRASCCEGRCVMSLGPPPL